MDGQDSPRARCNCRPDRIRIEQSALVDVRDDRNHAGPRDRLPGREIRVTRKDHFAAWLGHDPVMTQRIYAHVHAAEMRSLGEAFGQAITRDL